VRPRVVDDLTSAHSPSSTAGFRGPTTRIWSTYS